MATTTKKTSRIKPESLVGNSEKPNRTWKRWAEMFVIGAMALSIFIAIHAWWTTPSTHSQSADNQTTSSNPPKPAPTETRMPNSDNVCPNVSMALTITGDYRVINSGGRCVVHWAFDSTRMVDIKDSGGKEKKEVKFDDFLTFFWPEQVRSSDRKLLEFHYQLATK